MRNVFFLLVLWVLSGCSDKLDTPGEVLRIQAGSLEPAYINERYNDVLEVTGGLTPYNFRLSNGSLPPGLTLNSAGISGTPNTEGDYAFTITVFDANLSSTFAEYRLNVTEAPPATFFINVPTTDIKERVTLRGGVKDAKNLRALRTLLLWDTSRFKYVEGSVRARRNDVLIFEEFADGNLNIDMTILGEFLTGDAPLFEVTLEPLETNTLEVTARTEFLSETDAHAFSRIQAGTPPTERSKPEDGNNNGNNQDESNNSTGEGN